MIMCMPIITVRLFEYFIVVHLDPPSYLCYTSSLERQLWYTLQRVKYQNVLNFMFS